MASAVISVREATAPVSRAAARPRGFTPPAVRAAHPVRLSHLDPRPLWLEEAVVESPWRSGRFWAAYALCAPVAFLVRAIRG